MFKCDKIQIKTRYANYPGNDKIDTMIIRLRLEQIQIPAFSLQ